MDLVEPPEEEEEEEGLPGRVLQHWKCLLPGNSSPNVVVIPDSKLSGR